MNGLFPYIFIWGTGIFVVMYLFKRSLPIWLELILIILMFTLSYLISNQKSDLIEYFIKDSELKALCYQTIVFLYTTSQLLLIPIWYIIRFMKITPHEINTQIFGICMLIFIFIGPLTMLMFDILKEIHLFPYIL